MLAFDIFSADSRIAPAPKFDRTCPMKYFLEKYAGGPTSNIIKRKPVTQEDILRAALRIQTMFRVWKARKIKNERQLLEERRRFMMQETLRK